MEPYADRQEADQVAREYLERWYRSGDVSDQVALGLLGLGVTVTGRGVRIQPAPRIRFLSRGVFTVG